MSIETPTAKRGWFRFSLRTLLVVVVVAAVPLGFLTRSMQLGARQRRAVETLRESGFGCNYDYGIDESGNDRFRPHLPPWLLARFGEDFFYNVDSVFSFDDETTEGLSHLRDFPRLKRVEVTDRPIGDAVARQLSGLQQLKSLDLSNSALTDNGLKYLRGLTGLESLYLHDNPISGAGLIYIGDSRHLTTLMLESTGFDDGGMRYLESLTELRELGIGSSPNLTDEGIKVLAPMFAMKQLSIIDTGISDEGLAALKNMRSLELLILVGNEGIRGAGLVHFKQMSQLTSLHLTGCGIDDAALGHLEGCACRLLHLGKTHIIGPGLAHLKTMPRLHFLDLSENTIDSIGLQHLSGASKLRNLVLRGCEVYGTGLAALTQLDALNLIDVAVTESMLAELTELPLKLLLLDNTNVDASGLERLSAMPRLEDLSLHGCAIGDSAIPILKTFPKLELLYMDEGAFSAAGIQQLRPIEVR